jgi:hypothetical protein
MIPWNKGLTKETDTRVKLNSENVSKAMTGRIGRRLTDAEKTKLSLRQSLHNSGGKSKWFEVNGIKVQGTWERDFALKLNESRIEWSRGTSFIYHRDNKEKRYTPDFYLPSIDRFIEIKGVWWGSDKEKMSLVIGQNIFLKTHLILIEKAQFKEIMTDNVKLLNALCSSPVERPSEERSAASSTLA